MEKGVIWFPAALCSSNWIVTSVLLHEMVAKRAKLHLKKRVVESGPCEKLWDNETDILVVGSGAEVMPRLFLQDIAEPKS